MDETGFLFDETEPFGETEQSVRQLLPKLWGYQIFDSLDEEETVRKPRVRRIEAIESRDHTLPKLGDTVFGRLGPIKLSATTIYVFN